MVIKFLLLIVISSLLVDAHLHLDHHGHFVEHEHEQDEHQQLVAEINYAAVPFDLSKVTLSPGSLFDVMESRNIDYLLGLDSTRLACLYTSAANLTGTINRPTCNPYGHPQYYGHYLGHWLSATALGYASTGNETLKTKAAGVVQLLQNCQNAWTAKGDTGYLFPYDTVSFKNLENPPGNCQPVCVPFYVMHKMMAGLMDQYTLSGNTMAFTMVKAMGTWVKTNVESVISRGGERLWQQVLETEWGGMNEALYNLYSLTNDNQYLTAAYYFNHYTWTAPLSVNIDILSGNHANTHIPEVIGDARGYELTQNSTQKAIGTNFFNILLGAHTFSTGGSNDNEYWGPAHRLGDQMNANTEESCTTYNILKLARHLYQWSANSSLFDFYERALFNGLIGNQNRLSPYGPTTHSTGFIYFLPLGGGGLRKPWGASNGNGFPCCWGTLSETFSKLGDSIYFKSPDNTNLYVNLFASSTVSWAEAGVKVSQTAGFPASTTSTTSITISGNSSPVSLTINVRVPYWAVGKNTITVNGTPVTGTITPETYFSIKRSWTSGDIINVYYQPTLRFEQIDDNRPAWKGVGSIMYGALMLAAISNTDHIAGDPSNLNSWITRTSTTDLTFTAKTNSICSAASIQLIPLMDVMTESYAVTIHTGASAPADHYSPSGSVLAGSSASDFSLTGGASIVPNGNDENIRSGDPGETTTVSWTTPVQDNTHVIESVQFSYRYVSGYGSAGQHTGTVLSLLVDDGCGGNAQTLYKSPELVNYPFDSCNTCYSPAQVVNVGSLNLAVTSQKTFTVSFQNNNRNIQLLLPMNITVNWK